MYYFLTFSAERSVSLCVKGCYKSLILWVDVHFSYFELKVTVAVGFFGSIKETIPPSTISSVCLLWQTAASDLRRSVLCQDSTEGFSLPKPRTAPVIPTALPRAFSAEHRHQSRLAAAAWGLPVNLAVCVTACTYEAERRGVPLRASNEKLH